MQTETIKPGAEFSGERTREIVEAFYRDGFVHIPGVLEPGEVEALKKRVDELMDDPVLVARVNPNLSDRRYVQMHKAATGEERPFILRNTIELDPIFLDMLMREPILSLAEAIVGPDCKFCGQNVLRNLPGTAIEKWHVDGALHFPVPDGVARHDPRIRPPVLWITVQIALSDIDAIEHGPTQYVPGSHFSGRHPNTQDNPANTQDNPANTQDNPEFEGQGPVSLFCKAGDIYLQEPQCWHRGAPTTSDRTRYLMQSQYAVEWAYRRFGWMNRVPVPEETLSAASDRLLGVLGCRRPEDS